MRYGRLLAALSIFLVVCASALGVLAAGDVVPKVSETYRHYSFDLNWVDKLDAGGKPLSNYRNLKAEEHVQELVDMHANSLMLMCMSMTGYTFFDSRVGERHPTLTFDYVREMIRLGHRKGIAMELYLTTTWGTRLVQQHPSWGMRDPDGALLYSGRGFLRPDPNSPAAEWFVDVIHELVPSYPGDGFFADGLSFPRYGQSEYTVKKFRRDLGRPYPRSLKEDPDWRGTVRWEIGAVEAFWLKLRAAVKRGDPTMPVTFNELPGPEIQMPGDFGGSYGGFVALPPHLYQLADYGFTEAGSTGEYATWLRAVCWPKPFKVTFLSRHSILDPFDPNETRAKVGRTVAVGGQPYRYDRTSVDGEPNRYFTRAWAEMFREVAEMEPYLKGAEPVKYVAVVSSEPTMLYRGRSDKSSHANDLIGALRLLDAIHVQHDVVADWNLKADFLMPYQLVILPNVGLMSDGQVQAVREYVERGGTVLATAESSLFDADGKARSDFGLSDVLGVRIDESPLNSIQTVDRKRPVYIDPGMDKHPILSNLPPTPLIVPGDSVYVKPADADPTLHLIEDAGTPSNAPDRVTQRAAVQVHAFGKGMAIYFCGSLFARSIHRLAGDDSTSAWGRSGVRWFDVLVNNIVNRYASKRPWRMETSAAIWAGLNLQKAHNRHILHLVNWQTDLPAHNVEVALSRDMPIGRKATIVWPVEHELSGRAGSGSMTYTVPELGPHMVIVFEN